MPPVRRQLSHHEQTEILTDIQQNHRFQQSPVDPRSPTNSHQHPFSIFQQQRFSQQQERHIIPLQPTLDPTQQSIYSPQSQLTHQQPSVIFSQPPTPIAEQQSPILLSLQQSPLSSPQFSAIFSREPHTTFSTQNSALATQPSPVLLSLQNSPLSAHQPKELFSLQLQTTHATPQSPVPTQQSPENISQHKKSPLSAQKSTVVTQESRENQPNLEPKTQGQKAKEEDTTDLEGLQEDINTEFTIQQSISDPEELKKLQLLELQREQERKERQRKLHEEQLRIIQEQHERRLKERLEEDKRDEDRRLKLQEQLRKIHEEKEKRRKEQEQEQRRLQQERKERLLKLQQEEQLRLAQDKERQKKEDEEEKLKSIKEQKEKENQQKEPSLSSVINAQQSTATAKIPQEIILQPSHKEKRPRQRARIVEDPHSSIASEELFLQNERQKLFYQLKEAQEQQEKKQHSKEEKQQTQESQQVTRNNQRPENQILQTRSRQPVAQQSKLSQLEEQLHQKQLQEQLQKQFQLQLLQRQDLLRQLKLAVSNAATPTNEDQIAPGPPVISGGNSSAQLFLANGQKIQVVQSPRQGSPLADTLGNVSLATFSASTTTQRPSRALLEELTKGVIPPGADFEVIRHKQDGALEEIGKQLPQNLPQKKVTFVFLEEQSDGSFKVKGVRGNNNGENEEEEDQSSTSDVESIIKQIQEGDLKLPPSSNNRVLQQNPVPLLPTSLPPATDSRYIPQTTVKSLSTTSKPNPIIRTVSSNFNIESRATTAKPNSITKMVSSNSDFHPQSGMDFLQLVTFPPFYEVEPIVKTAPGVKTKTQVQTAPTDLPVTKVNSPYSVEAHVAGQNAAAHIFPLGVLSPQTQLNSGSSNSYSHNNQQTSTSSANIDENFPRYEDKSNTVTPLPTVTQFPPTAPSSTFFPPNKYSPSHTTQFTTPAPEKKFEKHEPFLPTEPSFVNPSQSYSQIFVPGNVPKQTANNHNTHFPGIIYANPVTQAPVVTTGTPIQQGTFQHHDVTPNYNYNERDFHQTVEAPSLRTPTRISAPPLQDIRKETDSSVPLDEDGSVEYQTKVEAPLSLAEVLKKEGLFAMARFLRESGLNDMLNDTGECLYTSSP